MNAEWKNKLSLLHKRINENDTSAVDDDHHSRQHFVRGDESMRPLSLREESVALMDPALAAYHFHDSAPSGRSDRRLGDHAWGSSVAAAANESVLEDYGYGNDYSVAEHGRHDDSCDNVNQGTPTKHGFNSTSDQSTSSPESAVMRSTIGPDDSRAVDYDPYLKAVAELSYASENSNHVSDHHVIKALDFGASVDYHYDDLSVIFDDDEKTKIPEQRSVSRMTQSPFLSTPPRSAVAAVAHHAAASPSGLPGGTRGGLRPPSISSPASPETSGRNASFNKTPSRIPMSVSRGLTGAHVSPTQERSTSKFADALRRHGQEIDSDADVVAPLTMSKTVGLTQHRLAMTPQAKPGAHTAANTPATYVGSKLPPTPAPTPLVLPKSRHVADVEAFNASMHAQRPDTTGAYTEGYDEWKEAWTPVGKRYFYNRRTRKSAWRLPPSTIHIKVPGEPDKLFVPHDRESVHSGGVEVDLMAETAVMGFIAAAKQTESAATRSASNAAANMATMENVNSIPVKATVDWGEKCQVFTAVQADKENNNNGGSVLKPQENKITRNTELPVETPSTPVVTAQTVDSGQGSSAPHTEQAESVADEVLVSRQMLSEMKCKTLMFCPLCADVILPQRFGSHCAECPEIATLAANGEFNIIINALSDGFASFSMGISQAVGEAAVQPETVSKAHMSRLIQGGRPDSSPMPSRVLDFGAHDNENESNVPHAEGNTYKSEKVHESEGGLGNTVAHNKCAFCGKPSSKSALSAHLLVCKSRKQMQMKRQATMENSMAATFRGEGSAGKTRPMVARRNLGSSTTPQRRRRNGGSDAPSSVGNTDKKGNAPTIWGSSSTPNVADRGVVPVTMGEMEGSSQFISPAGVSDAINSAARHQGDGENKSATKTLPRYASPLKAAGLRAGSAQRNREKALADRTNAQTPTRRTITTRVFM